MQLLKEIEVNPLLALNRDLVERRSTIIVETRIYGRRLYIYNLREILECVQLMPGVSEERKEMALYQSQKLGEESMKLAWLETDLQFGDRRGNMPKPPFMCHRLRPGRPSPGPRHRLALAPGPAPTRPLPSLHTHRATQN